MRPGDAEPRAGRSRASLLWLLAASGLACAALLALGTWQLERRAWKLALVERVEARVHAPPVPAPGRAEWPAVTAERDEYRRVRATGTFLHERETLVAATTELGAGFWVLSPLRRPDNTVVLVNRGFVPPERRDPATRAAGQQPGEATVTGLLRMTEPGGTALRANDPAAGRWYSRDVAAIAAAQGLADTAPFFIDAEADPGSQGPVGGLTVVAFRNHHLVYAATWYGLALTLALATAHAVRQDWPRRNG